MLAVKQDERFTINFRDASERTPKNGIFLIGDGLVGREWFRTHGFIHCFHQLGCVRWLPALSSKLVGDPKANDSAQPRPQLCRLAKFWEFLPCCYECFLGEILALGHASCGAIRK